MVRSVFLEPKALEDALIFTRMGARPSVVSSILQGYRSTEVEKVCRSYAADQELLLPKGPLPADDARVTLGTISRRIHLSGAISLYERLVTNGGSEVEALKRSYQAYEGLAWHLRDTDQFVSFERFYVAVRSFVGQLLKLQPCMKCSTQFLVSENPEVRRDCPFCYHRSRGLFKGRLEADTSAPMEGRPLRAVLRATG